MDNQPVTWTIMAYINADNILANFAVESLKQLRNAASDHVTVIAEFADNQPDRNQERNARLYRFDGTKRDDRLDASLLPEKDWKGLMHLSNVDMTRPQTLTEFIDFSTQKFPADRYCLILWGHGIELLMDDDRRFATARDPEHPSKTPADLKPANGDPAKNKPPAVRYLTVANLRKALSETKLAATTPGSDFSRKTLDIIGFDACSMSMIEVAATIQKYADYIIASQEDVPDVSFPYEKILAELEAENVRGDVRKVCTRIPQLYQDTYRDYIATPGTGVKGITLASLDLRKTGNLTAPLKKLAAALHQASYVPEKYDAIFSARESTKDFVFGILADLDDFCKNLQEAFATIKDANIALLCQEVRDALKRSQDGFIVENQVTSVDGECSGISIYFPYRDTDDATEELDERLSKGTGNRPLKGTANRPLKERAARIRELEADFLQLDDAAVGEWMRFIQKGWSFILANKVQFSLDYHYSAEQCVANLLGRNGAAGAKAA